MTPETSLAEPTLEPKPELKPVEKALGMNVISPDPKTPSTPEEKLETIAEAGRKLGMKPVDMTNLSTLSKEDLAEHYRSRFKP